MVKGQVISNFFQLVYYQIPNCNEKKIIPMGVVLMSLSNQNQPLKCCYLSFGISLMFVISLESIKQFVG